MAEGLRLLRRTDQKTLLYIRKRPVIISGFHTADRHLVIQGRALYIAGFQVCIIIHQRLFIIPFFPHNLSQIKICQRTSFLCSIKQKLLCRLILLIILNLRVQQPVFSRFHRKPLGLGKHGGRADFIILKLHQRILAKIYINIIRLKGERSVIIVPAHLDPADIQVCIGSCRIDICIAVGVS